MWKRRQQHAYEAMWREIDRKRRKERFIAGPLGWVVTAPSVLTSWPFVIALIAVLSLAWVTHALAVDASWGCVKLASLAPASVTEP